MFLFDNFDITFEEILSLSIIDEIGLSRMNHFFIENVHFINQLCHNFTLNYTILTVKPAQTTRHQHSILRLCHPLPHIDRIQRSDQIRIRECIFRIRTFSESECLVMSFLMGHKS